MVEPKPERIKSHIKYIFSQLAKTVTLKHIVSKDYTARGQEKNINYKNIEKECVITSKSLDFSFEEEGESQLASQVAHFRDLDTQNVGSGDKIIDDDTTYKILDINEKPEIKGQVLLISCDLEKIKE